MRNLRAYLLSYRNNCQRKREDYQLISLLKLRQYWHRSELLCTEVCNLCAWKKVLYRFANIIHWDNQKLLKHASAVESSCASLLHHLQKTSTLPQWECVPCLMTWNCTQVTVIGAWFFLIAWHLLYCFALASTCIIITRSHAFAMQMVDSLVDTLNSEALQEPMGPAMILTTVIGLHYHQNSLLCAREKLQGSSLTARAGDFALERVNKGK